MEGDRVSHVDWEALRMLRWSGRKPALPVIVTTKRELPPKFDGVGCMVILHRSGEPFPAALLRDLRVMAFFDVCADATKVARIFDKLDCWPASFQVWCECGSSMTILPTNCKTIGSYVDEWA